MVCHEPEFYDGLADDVWDCSEWTTKLFQLYVTINNKRWEL